MQRIKKRGEKRIEEMEEGKKRWQCIQGKKEGI